MTSTAHPPLNVQPLNQDSYWFNYVCLASRQNDVDALSGLLASYQPSVHGDLGQVDGGEWCALHYAISTDSDSALRLLLSHGFDIKGFDISLAGRSEKILEVHHLPLHFACRFKSFRCLETLLEAGVDLQLLTSGGMSALDVLTQNWTRDINADAEGNSIRCLLLLLDAGMSTAATMDDGFGVIHACASRGLTQPLAALLESKDAKASMEAFDKNDKCDRTPLGYAFQNDHPECVALLLDAGCDPHLTNKMGVCALDGAKENSASLLLYRSRLALASAKQALSCLMDEAQAQHQVRFS